MDMEKDEITLESREETEVKDGKKKGKKEKNRNEKMNKKSRVLFVFIILLFTLLVAGLGYFAYNHFTKEEVIDERLFTMDTLPRVDASLATQPLMDKFISFFTGTDLSDVNMEYTNTHPAYEKLASGETDLIIVTSPSDEAKSILKEKGVEIELIPVVNEAFVFFVNKDNKVDNLTLEEVQGIYSGKITNWNEVGGNNSKILAYQRPDTSGSQTGLKDLVMKDIKIKEPLTEEFAEGMSDVINYVADYKDDERAIAYSYYYYANVMYYNENIKFLGINGINPTFKTIQDGSYPLLTSYYIVINKNEPEDSDVRKLANAMLSEKGQIAAQEAGYVPIK